jgi:CRP-like cAMP-binding protein
MTARHTAGVRLFAEHALSNVGWLAGEAPEFRERLLSIARWRSYRPSEHLYEVGDAANGLFGLEEGRIDVSIPISDDEMVTMHRAQPGLWIGDSALLSGASRGVSLVAHGECLVLTVPVMPLKRMLEEHPHDYACFYRLAHANMMQTLHVLAETIALPPRARFARMLLRLTSRDGMVEATQAELGSLAGMSRAAFRRAFSELIKSGVVKLEYGAVRILDMDALLREVNAR